MSLPPLHSRSRVMMFAPHPDDESLAAGIFLQRAVACGARLRIVYATDGERNGWPQRLLERKLRLRERDRFRWGARRRAEAVAALRSLGAGAADAQFLSLPDQGVTDLLFGDCELTMRRLGEIIRRWAPTDLLLPSPCDTHPDHSGLAVLLRIALDHYLPRDAAFTRLNYLVHGSSISFAREAEELFQHSFEQTNKRRAIRCHVTQVALSRRRFLSYAERPERFVVAPKNARAKIGDGPIREFARGRDDLRLRVAFTLKPLRAEATTLYLLGHDSWGRLRRLRTALPARNAPLHLIDCASGAIACIGQYRGDAFHADITLPLTGLVNDHSVFVKLDRRVWFFDEAGWLEIEAVRRAVGARELAVA
ncbi:MAG TPA: PIG-L family deacetylase [Chthoniobacterales bacterium]|jgi:LmbE family N-acetylglucosaminyl deacetylase